MSRYRKIDPRIWNDAKFRSLTDAGKLAFLFVLTHPHMTALGAMRGSVPGLAAEIGWTAEAFGEAFREGCARAMAEHDDTACLIWLPNFLKYNPPESPNVVKAWVASIDLIPECDLKNKAIQSAKALAEGMGEAFAKALPKAFIEALSKAMPNQEQEQEQEQEKKLPTADAVGARSDAAAPPASAQLQLVPSTAAGKLQCPHDRLIALYHEILPACPRIRNWHDGRKRYMQTRWREQSKPNGAGKGYASVEEGLTYWRKFFEHVGRSRFLTGQTDGRNGAPPFVADLEWLMRASNFAKVVEGKYHDAAA